MLGRSHCLTGLTYGATVAGELAAWAPPSVRLLLIPVGGGAALLPDIDKVGSRIARSIGPITGGISRVVAWISEEVYLATRTAKDSPYTNGGHRQLTHSWPGFLLVGGLVGLAMLSPISGGLVLGFLCGLMLSAMAPLVAFAQGLLRFFKVRARRSEVRILLFLTFAATAWFNMRWHMDWWWIWPPFVAGGALIHSLGDGITQSGVPLTFPFCRQGKRWYRVKIRGFGGFVTGSEYELTTMARRLWFLFVLSLAYATGVLQPVVRAVYVMYWGVHR